MPLTELDKVLLDEEEEFSELDKVVLEDIPSWQFQPKEFITETIPEKAKDIYNWMYPQGMQDLPRQWGAALTAGGLGIGQAATHLARLCPNQEDLPDYTKQKPATQALTLAQATSLIALAGLIGYTGISAIGSLAKNLIYGRADKIADKFATQHFAKIKALNSQVKTLEDAKALTEASLRGVVSPAVETGYPPTVMSELAKLGKRLLQPLVQNASAAEFKANLTRQTAELLRNSGIVPKKEIMQPFIRTIEHYVAAPKTGIITPQFGAATVDIINKFIPKMIDSVKAGTEAFIPFEKPLTPEERIVEEQIRRPLTSTPEEYVVLGKAEQIAKEAVEPGEVEDLGLSIKAIAKGEIPTFPTLDTADEIKFSEAEARFSLGKVKDAIGRSFYRNYALRFELDKKETDMLFRNFFSTRELREKSTKKWLEHTFGTITAEDAIALSLHQENPKRYPIPDKLKSVAEKQTAVYEFYDKVLQSYGVYKEAYPQSMITRSYKQIDKLKEELEFLKQPKAKQGRIDKIEQLEELIGLLKTTRYLPHRYVGRIENLIIEESADKDVTRLIPRQYSNVLRATFKEIKKRKIPTLEEAAKLGFVPQLDARVIMGNYVLYVQNEIAKADLARKLIADPDLVLPEGEAPLDWQKVAMKAFGGYKVHPALADTLDEVAGIKGKEWDIVSWYAGVAKTGKMLKFYNPMIMVVNNLAQAYWRAGVGAAIDPRLWTWSVKQITGNTPLYQKFIEEDLFPTPPDIRPTKKSQDEMIMMWVRAMDKNYPKVARALERVSNGKWNFKGKTSLEALGDTVKGFYATIWNATWTLDRIQRMNTTKRLMEKGMSFEKAVEQARFFHVDYADLPSKARRALNLGILTPAYRTGILKIMGTIARHPWEYRGPLARQIMAIFGVVAGATIAGYTWKEQYRLTKEEGDKERVVTLPGPLFELQKYLGRGPKGSFYIYSSVPVHITLSIARNRDWKGDRIYYSAESIPQQAADVARYILRTYISPIEGMDMLTDADQRLRDRLLRYVAVSSYTREQPEKWQAYKISQLRKDIIELLKDKYPEGAPDEVVNELVERATERAEKIAEATPSLFDVGARMQKGILRGLSKFL